MYDFYDLFNYLYCCSTQTKHVYWQKEMHKYFVDAELNSMLGSTYDNIDYSEVHKNY